MAPSIKTLLALLIVSLFSFSPILGQTYTTSGSGNWNSPGNWVNGQKPGTSNLNGIIINVLHDMDLQNSSISLEGGSELNVDGGSLTFGGGGLEILDGSLNINDGSMNLPPGSNLSVLGVNSNLMANNSVLEIGGNFSNMSGAVALDNVCLTVHGDLVNDGGTNNFYNSCVIIDGSLSNINGGHYFNQFTNYYVINGDFLNAQGSYISGSINALYVQNGDLLNNGNWFANVNAYKVPNGIVTVNSGNLPLNMNNAILVFFNPCSCNLNDPIILSIVVNDILCFGDTSGSLNLSTSGGVPPYTYFWSNGDTSQTTLGLSVGNYTVTVTDASGTTAMAGGYINETPSLDDDVILTPISCPGMSDGGIEVVISGGTSPYTYQWDNGITIPSLSGLPAGYYELLVYDVNGCALFQSVALNDPDPMVISPLAVNPQCFGENSGSIQLSISGGTAPFSYQWSNGSTNPYINNVGHGQYQVTVTDAAGCSADTFLTLTQPQSMALSLSSSDALCNGGDEGTASALVAGGNAPYQFNWSDGQSGNYAYLLSAGSYSLTVIDSLGCSVDGSVSIGEPAGMTVNVSTIDASCNGAQGGSASVQVTNGGGGYTFLWDNGQQGQTLSNVPSGNYVLTVIDANGCTVTSNANIASGSTAQVVLNTNPISCSGGSDGSATVASSGTNTNLSITWSDGQTGPIANNLSAGSYSVEIIDGNNCSSIEYFFLADPAPIQLSLSSTNPHCEGALDGSLSVQATGGQAPFTFVWDNGLQGSSISGVGVGFHTVTATDAAGCSQSETLELTAPQLINLTTLPVDENCNGAGLGHVNLVANGGGGNLTYLWSNGVTTQNNPQIPAGTYTVTVTDQDGCSNSATGVVGQKHPFIVGASSIDATCYGSSDGSAVAVATDGTAPYSYVWSNGQTGAQLTNVPAGTYYVSVTDDKTCEIVHTVVIGQSPELVLSLVPQDVSCNGITDGSLEAIVSGGVAPYSYQWSNGSTASVLNNLGAGTYNLVVTDASGCLISGQSVIYAPAGIQLELLVTDVSCNGGMDGSVTAVVSGGGQGLTYTWSNGQSGNQLSGLGSGPIQLSVFDINGCSATAMATVNEPSTLTVQLIGVDPSCQSGSDGSIDAIVQGGSAPYSFVWSNGATTSLISGLQGGPYFLQVSDANGCLTVGNTTLAEITPFVVEVTQTDVSCYGSADGSIEINASGGLGAISFSWNNGSTANTQSGLQAGNYSVMVSTGGNCYQLEQIEINQPNPLYVNSIGQGGGCYSSFGGTATTMVTGGTSPYNYSWSNGMTSSQLSMVSSGDYTVTVSDLNGCQTLDSVNIPSGVITVDVSVTDVSCYGAADGEAVAQAIGGVGPYTYAWMNGNVSPHISSLPAGVHALQVSDINGCFIMHSVVIGQPDSIQVQFTHTDASCLDALDGTAIASGLGGTAPYTFLWSNNQVGPHATNLAPGPIGISILDANNCPATDHSVVPSPAPIVIELVSTPSTCNGNSDGTIASAITGGTAPFTYVWDNGSTTADLSNVAPGSYSLDVFDANGCSASSNVIVGGLSVDIATFGMDATCNGLSDGSAEVLVLNGTGPFTYLWDNGATTSTITNLGVGSYSVTVSDSNGCAVNEVVSISQSAGLIGTLSVTGVNCSGGSDGSASVVVSGGTGNYSYLWSNGEFMDQTYNLAGGIIEVTVIDGQNCELTLSDTVNEPTPLVITGSSTQESSIGAQDGSASVVASGGTGPYFYHWNGFGNVQTINNVSQGFYNVTVIDANGCSEMIFVEVGGQALRLINPEEDDLGKGAQGSFASSNNDLKADLMGRNLNVFCPKSGQLTIELVDLSGNLVVNVASQYVSAGSEVRSNLVDNVAPGGVYFYKVSFNGEIKVMEKIAMIK